MIVFRYPFGDECMKNKGIVMLLTLLMLSTALVSLASAGSVRAGESITTDKEVYVVGETIHVYVHAANHTWYNILVDNTNYDSVYTNATGYATTTYHAGAGFFGLGTHKLSLERNNNVLANATIVVRAGLQLWPSTYTGTHTYLNGEKMWVKLSAAGNKNYTINITNSGGTQVYPANENMIVHTDNDGVAVFNITLNIGDGPYLLNLGNGTTTIQSKQFSVESVEVVASIDKGSYGVYLLSEKIKVYVSIYWMKNHTLISSAPYKYWIVSASNSSMTFGPYSSDKNEFYTQPLSWYSTQNGDKIMENREYYLEIVYDSGSGVHRHAAEAKIPFYTGSLYGTISVVPLDGSMSPGNRVIVKMNTYAMHNGMQESPLANVNIDYLNITITDYWSVQWYKNWTKYGKTDMSGHARLIWTIPNVPAGSILRAEIKYSTGGDTFVTFTEVSITSKVSLAIKLDKSSYISGEKMVIDFYAKHPANVNVTGYDVWIYDYSYMEGMGNLLYYTTTRSDQITYTLPLNQSGAVYVKAIAHFSTGASAVDQKIVSVKWGVIYLSASSSTFMHAGDEIEIYSAFESNVMHTKTLEFKVVNDRGKVILQKTAAPGEFLFTVPDMNSDEYIIYAEATYENLRVSSHIEIDKFVGYYISVSLATESRYQNMVYQPGQVIKVRYAIERIGNFESHLPVLHWEILSTDYSGEKVLSANDNEGVVEIKLPTNIKGGCVIEFWIEDVDGTGSNFGVLSVNVEKGTWSMQSVAGMPLLSFINLILVIVAIIIGVVAIMLLRRGSGASEKGEEKEESEPGEGEHQEPKQHKPLFGGKKKKGPPKPFEPPAEPAESDEVVLPPDEDEIGEF